MCNIVRMQVLDSIANFPKNGPNFSKTQPISFIKVQKVPPLSILQHKHVAFLS